MSVNLLKEFISGSFPFTVTKLTPLAKLEKFIASKVLFLFIFFHLDLHQVQVLMLQFLSHLFKLKQHPLSKSKFRSNFTELTSVFS